MKEPEHDRIKALMAFELERTSPPQAFPSLPPIPRGRYTDPAFFELERNVLFRKTWLLAAHLDELPSTGSFLRWDIAGIPVVLVRDNTGTINALVNRCRHRGAPVAMAPCGEARRLTCPYHGWSYDHDGTLLSLREARDFRDLDYSALGLQRLRCELLGRLVFVNFDPGAASLQDSLAPLSAEWEEFDLGNCRLSRRDRFVAKCNWKIAMEANMEVYHVPTVHRATVAPRLDSRRNVNTFYAGGHGRMIAPIPADSPQPRWQSSWPEIPGVGELARTATQSYNVFPNLVMPLNQYVIPPIQFWPTGIDECVIETWTLAADWGAGEQGPDMWTEDNGNRPNLVLREDIEMSEAIQKSMLEGVDGDIHLGYQEARIYHHHQFMDRVIDAERIPPELRVGTALDERWWHPNEPRLA